MGKCCGSNHKDEDGRNYQKHKKDLDKMIGRRNNENTTPDDNLLKCSSAETSDEDTLLRRAYHLKHPMEIVPR